MNHVHIILVNVLALNLAWNQHVPSNHSIALHFEVKEALQATVSQQSKKSLP